MKQIAPKQIPSKRVLIYGLPFSAANSNLLVGIMRYAYQPARWMFSLHESPQGLLKLVRSWQPQGVLFHGDVPLRFKQFAHSHKVPIVGIGWPKRDEILYRVRSDEQAAGRLAAEHLRACGFRHFGFYGSNEPFNNAQNVGFTNELAKAGFKPRSFRFPPASGGRFSFEKRIGEVIKWLDRFQFPVGILIARDGFAPRIAQACERKGLRIPEDVAVIGVGDNQVHSQLVRPSLSIVERNVQRVGYEAAAMLDRLMDRQPVQATLLSILPRCVVTRGSTDILAVEDKRIAVALRFIRERCPEPVSVSEVAERAHMSRRSFEQHFRETMGRSPAAEVRRLRIEEAKRLLRETDLKVSAVAEACHFKSDKDFWSTFRRVVSTSPYEYRRSHLLS